MIKEGKFGVNETVSILTITITTKVFYTSPALLADMLATSGWYMTLISAATAIIGFTFIYLLLKRFPNHHLIDIYKIVFGPFLGFIFSFLLALLLLFISFTSIREFIDVLKVYVLPKSSLNYLALLFLTVPAAFCFYGLESIVRFARLCAYFLLSGLIIVLLLSCQNYRTYNLFPFWGYGINKTLLHGLIRSSSYGEIIILAVIAPSLQGIRYIKKAGYMSLIFSGILISAVLLSFTLSFPYTTASEITSLMYELTMQIDYGRFLQRLDPVFLFVWVISSFISASILLYSFLSIYNKIFNINDIKPCLPIFFIMVFYLVLLPKDLTSIITVYIQFIRSFSWILVYILPFFALILAKLLNKKGGTKNV